MPPPRVTVAVVAIRTTSDSEGHPHGIATGMGVSPELALSALKQAAHTQADVVAFPYRQAFHPPPSPPAPEISASGLSGGRSGRAAGDYSEEWRFEVVDVRLVPALMEGGESGWLAYGTLLSESERPRRVVVPGRPPRN